MLPYGTSVKVYDANGFIGPSVTIDGQPSHESWPMDCISLNNYPYDDTHWGNEASSLEVYRTRLGARAVGRWTAITATEKLKFHYHVGMSSRDSSESKEVMSQSIGLDISAGMSF